MDEWFEIDKVNSHLFVLRERLDKIDSRYHTIYTNLYLILGDHSALLIDTGSGIGNLKRKVEEISKDRDLFVVNTHNHFDHIGSNYQFRETHIHRLDLKELMKPMDVSFLSSSSNKAIDYFKATNFKIKFAISNVPLIGNEIFDLGNLIVEVNHTPGHTSGSICLITNYNELFTGDTFNLGALFLPGLDAISYFKESLHELTKYDNPKVFPGHENYNISLDSIFSFIEILENFGSYKSIRKFDSFLQSWIYEISDFKIIQPLEN